MHVLLVPFGSHGDVHPFVGLGHALRARGHRVTFVVNDYFGPLVRGLGFAMEPVGEARLFTEVLRDPDLWHPRRSFGVVARNVVDHARLAYPIIERLIVPGETLAVGGSLAFAVRLAQERLGLPAATVHLQPGSLHSNFETPVYPGLEVPRWWPRWFKRAFFNQVFQRMVDPHLAPALNAYRAELGLPPVRDVFRTWMSSPELVLGLFPAWFGPPQPDWPPRMTLLGFPLYDEADATPLAPDLDAFLAAGSPPIAFTPGSANQHGRSFFEAAIDACVRLGRRGLLLTRHPEQVPTDLPDGIRHVVYAPFSRLLPRVAALAHHGGIGTSSQGMAAGVPQLVMPLGHDQFDNAARMGRLGVARTLVPRRFRGPVVASALRTLLDSPAIAANCRTVAGLVQRDSGSLERAAEAIEQMPQIVHGKVGFRVL
jgi:UDP:flavonoid glycosyltransferase YjiC (YdhE family)